MRNLQIGIVAVGGSIVSILGGLFAVSNADEWYVPHIKDNLMKYLPKAFPNIYFGLIIVTVGIFTMFYALSSREKKMEVA